MLILYKCLFGLSVAILILALGVGLGASLESNGQLPPVNLLYTKFISKQVRQKNYERAAETLWARLE